MRSLKTLRAVGLLVSALALAACGNDQSQTASLLKSIPAQIKARKAGPQKINSQQIAQALAATPKPLFLMELEQTGSQFMLLEIERNGPHQTFGNSSRQSVAMRGGMITGTRGLGGDLMSVEEAELLSIVSRRGRGVANYVQRFQTQEYVTATHRYTCTVEPTGQSSLTLMGITSSGTVMNARCVGDQGSFTNTYVVDGSGYIVSARQWVSQDLKYLSSQSLRR